VAFVAELFLQFVGEMLIEGAWHGSRRLWLELTGKKPIPVRPIQNRKRRTSK